MVGVDRSQVHLTLAGWRQHSDSEVNLGLARLSGGQRRPPVPCLCVGLIEQCCSWCSGEIQVGQTSVGCVDLVVERHKMPAVTLVETVVPPYLLVAVLAVAVLLLSLSSLDLL